MNKKRTYGLKDFVIEESTIPPARPIKLMDGSWGVFVSHEDLPELRNHLIVSVQTKDIIGLQVPPRGLIMLALHQIRNSYAIPIRPFFESSTLFRWSGYSPRHDCVVSV